MNLCTILQTARVGTIYPFLNRAVEAGLLQRAESPEGRKKQGPEAVYYDLTPAGLLLAHAELQLVQVVDLDKVVERKRA